MRSARPAQDRVAAPVVDLMPTASRHLVQTACSTASTTSDPARARSTAGGDDRRHQPLGDLGRRHASRTEFTEGLSLVSTVRPRTLSTRGPTRAQLVASAPRVRQHTREIAAEVYDDARIDEP
jgi:hypothetical protein